MARKEVGPLAITRGVFLSPASASPVALLDSLNLEESNGALATRGGTSPLQCSYTSDITTIIGTHHPLTWIGETVTYFGITTALLPNPDEVTTLSIAAATSETEIQDGVTIEYYDENDEWRTLNYLNFPEEKSGKLGWMLTAAQGAWGIRFVVPHGWKDAQPAGLPSTLSWLRITAPNAWTVNPALGVLVTFDLDTGFLSTFKTRSAWKTVHLAVSNASTPPVPVFSVLDTDAVPLRPDYVMNSLSIPAAVSSNGVDVGSGSTAQMVYIPATDDWVSFVSPFWLRYDCSNWDGSGAMTELVLGDGQDSAYEDIPLESVLPSPSAVALYNTRLFVADSEKGRILWSAPEEFWDTFPRVNQAYLSSRGAGEIVALEEMGGVLYAFTTSSIFQVIEVDPIDGEESSMNIRLFEETGCVSARSVVPIEGGIIFLGADGIRLLANGRTRIISGAIQDVFRETSEHPLAVRRSKEAVGVWHPVENEYRLFYPLADSVENDTCIVVDLSNGACWFWGADQVSGIDTSGASGPIGQRHYGIRGTRATWSQPHGKVLISDRTGNLMSMDTGDKDMGAPVAWRLESQLINISNFGMQVVSQVDFSVLRQNFASMSVSVIPDGRLDRKDSRTVAIQSDGLDVTGVLDSGSLAGEALLELSHSYTSLFGRFRSRGRNHRVMLESVSPHLAVEVASMFVSVNTIDPPSRRRRRG